MHGPQVRRRPRRHVEAAEEKLHLVRQRPQRGRTGLRPRPDPEPQSSPSARYRPACPYQRLPVWACSAVPSSLVAWPVGSFMAIRRQAVAHRCRSSAVPPRTRTKVSTEDSLAGMESLFSMVRKVE
jgi:hypothetical protein